MSYSNATVSPAERVRAASGVIAIHALVAAGVIAGLAVTVVIEPEDENFEGITFEVEPPPTPPVEDNIPDQPDTTASTVVVPEPPITIVRDVPVDTTPIIPDFTEVVVRNPVEILGDIPVAEVTPITPAFDPIGPIPRNQPQGWITNDDYPRRGITRELEGTLGYRLVIGSNGRVNSCDVTRTSGHAVLDDAACRLLRRNARFNPAKNSDGQDVVGNYTGSVTWQLP